MGDPNSIPDESLTNAVDHGVHFQEAFAVFQDSRWTIYGWWLLLSICGGALGGIAFHPELTSPWWRLPVYVTGAVLLRKLFITIARRVFPKDFRWQITSMFLMSFLLACLLPAISALTSRTIVIVPVVVIGSLLIGYTHSIFRTVFVRDLLAWVYAAAPLATIAALIGWLLFRTETLTPASVIHAAFAGAIVGLVYVLLTTLLMELMWDASTAQSSFGTATLDQVGEIEEALALHEQAIALKPDDPKLYAARAEVYLKIGDVDHAKNDIAHALTLDPECAEARLQRAILIAGEGQLDEAIAEYDQLVDYKWAYHPAYFNRARAYGLKGDYDRALADYDHAIKFSDEPTLAHAYRADTYYKIGDYDRAIADCGRAMARTTSTPLAWTMAFVVRGKCYAARGEDELAADDFLMALESPSTPELLKETEDGLRALERKTQENLKSQ